MNKTEEAYSYVLEAKKRNGELLEWGFERFTLKLADDTRYTPDFFAVNKDGEFELHETKGFMRDDARVKLKAAVDRFHFFRFFLVKKAGNGWDIKELTP